jgi:hypothetical protein
MASFRQIAKQNIFPGESGGDYNALFGYSNRDGGRYGGTRLTDMTVNQALDFSQPSGDYGQWVKGQVGHVATPMGAYQVVGTTLRAAQQGLGLTGNERMDEGLQDRIGEWIYQNQGPGAWEGWRGNQSGGSTQARVSTRSAPTGGILSNEGNQMAQPQQPQGLLGSMGIQRRDPNAQGETSQPFYNRRSFGDTLARIAPALGRMGVMGLEGPAQAALDSRNERQGDERARAAQDQQRNQTREWIASQPNGADFVAMFDAVGLGPTVQAMQGADAVRGINVDGNLVNPVTGELMFAAGNGGASPSSAIAKLQADLSAGLINQEQYDLGLSNMAPSGMRIVSDGRGGFTMEQGSAVGAEDGRMSPSDPQAMIDSIDGILNDPALDRSTGLFSAMQNIPGTDQYRFGTRARQLEGQAFLQAFESLKGAGQITEVEGTKATQAVGRMDTALQADDYREALNDLRSILTTAQARGAAMQSPDGNAAAPAGARTRYDAEGNRL